MDNYTKIDIASWNRVDTYNFFKPFGNPFFNITANIDVTRLKLFCKKNELSFFLASLFMSQKVISKIDSFRYRIVNNEVRFYDQTHAGSTILLNDNSFSFCYFNDNHDIIKFVYDGGKLMDRVKKDAIFLPREGSYNMIYYSVIPWVSFTSFQHAYNKDENDSVPRIVFGKYFKSEGKTLMPVSVSVHHSLVDGFHVGQYFNKFVDEIELLDFNK